MFNNLLHYLKLILITGLLAGMSYSAYAAPVITPKIVPPPKPDPLMVLTDKVNSLQATVTSLQAANTKLTTDVNNLKSTVSSLQSDVIVGLGSVMTYDSANQSVLFTGVDVHIVNGMGSTGYVNGKGNLIVGYNEPLSPGSRNLYCSDGQFTTEQTCIDNGKSWQLNNRNGSHNIITGYGNDYTMAGGIVAGMSNVINGSFASVLAGTNNTASGAASGVSGGYGNITNEYGSSVSGGANNTASGLGSTVSGGGSNTANGGTVSGGSGNTANGNASSVSGGSDNTASGLGSTVSGGRSNTASNLNSSVSGGRSNTASGFESSVSGGFNVTMPNNDGWAAGGLTQ